MAASKYRHAYSCSVLALAPTTLLLRDRVQGGKGRVRKPTRGMLLYDPQLRAESYYVWHAARKWREDAAPVLRHWGWPSAQERVVV
jgi:hypothetical protein